MERNWLDRFSNYSTPSGSPPPPQNRAYSPAGKRPSHLGTHAPALPSRPSFSPRSSSLSLRLSPNTSTSSLPGTSRLANGSALRQEVSAPTPPNVPDPLEVLDSIIGERKTKSERGEEKGGSNGGSNPKHLVEDIDFGGFSLQEFAKETEASLQGGPVKHSRALSGVDYATQAEKFENLHNAIAGCDEVLSSVEKYFTTFQTELGVVSSEIESLQDRSLQLNEKLESRKKVEKLLGPAVEEISISPGVVREISEGSISDNWIKALNELETRSTAIKAKQTQPEQVKAVIDLEPLLNDLNNKAIERIRDYLVVQIKGLRSPNINAQIVQQQSFTRYKDMYAYLIRHHPALAEEIGQAYINTMRWYYLHNFTRYNQALEKLKLHNIDRHETLGSDQPNQRGNVLPGGRSAVPTYDAYNLGRRGDVLKKSSPIAISTYIAEEDKATHYLEAYFLNLNLALVDNVSAEYSFVTEFFSARSFHQVSRIVIEIFEPVFALSQSVTKHLVDGTNDCLGVLLCVRLNQQFAFELQRRKVPVADSYVNGTNMLLWPRFQQIMDAHCESLKKVSASSGRTAASALSLTGVDSSKQSTAPHFLTQRFGQFLHAILFLSSEAGDDEPTSSSLNRLRNEFDSLLLKLSKGMGDARKKERFLSNNYSLIQTIISDTTGKLAEDQKAHFDEAMEKARSGR